MQTYKYTILIPLAYNDGRKVPRKTLDRFMAEIYELADGWTFVGNVTGAYRMKDGSQQIESHRCLWVNVPRSKVRAFTRLVGKIGAQLGQEFMYLERSDGKVQLVPPLMEKKDDDENGDESKTDSG